MKIVAKIKPNSKCAKIAKGETWIIHTKSPATENRANLEAISLIASELNLPKSKIRLKLGSKARMKTFEIGE